MLNDWEKPRAGPAPPTASPPGRVTEHRKRVEGRWSRGALSFISLDMIQEKVRQ